MDRTFQARVTAGQWLSLILCTFLAGYGLWHKEWPVALLFMILLVLVIEQLIHSTYTILAEGGLVVRRGRFRKVKHIALADIRLVERVKAPLLGAWFVSHYVLVHDASGKTLALLPANEAEFLRVMEKRGCKVV